jgi:hypothetical protein
LTEIGIFRSSGRIELADLKHRKQFKMIVFLKQMLLLVLENRQILEIYFSKFREEYEHFWHLTETKAVIE